MNLHAALCFGGRFKQKLQKRIRYVGLLTLFWGKVQAKASKMTWAEKGCWMGLGVGSAMVAGAAGEASVVRWIRAQT